MDEKDQRDAIIGMGRDLAHLLRTVDEIKQSMATKGEIALLATKAEHEKLTARLETLEKEVERNAPGRLWRTLTGVAAGLVSIIAVVSLTIQFLKRFP